MTAVTILSAKYGNPANNSAVVQTVEHGSKAISQDDTPTHWATLMAWEAEGNTIAPVDPPQTPDELEDAAISALGPVILNLAYNLDKRLLVLEGKPARTKDEVKIILKGWLVP